mgnify:CR=1 FL=1
MHEKKDDQSCLDGSDPHRDHNIKNAVVLIGDNDGDDRQDQKGDQDRLITFSMIAVNHNDRIGYPIKYNNGNR